MQPIVLFADIEAWAKAFLAEQLEAWPAAYADAVHVATEIPNPRPDRMVIIRRDGGPQLSVVTELVRLNVRVFATTREDVTDLTNLVRGILAASPGEGPIRAHRTSTAPVWVPDESGQPLRMFTAELVARSV